MDTVYVAEQGAQICKEGHRLLVKKGGRIIDEIMTADLEQIVLIGNVTLTVPVMDALIRDRVDTVFITQSGRFRGRLLTAYSKNVDLRRQQYMRLSQPDFALQSARSIIRGKLSNMRILIMRYGRRMKDPGDVGRTATRIRALNERLDETRDLDEVRGIEGMGTRHYFSVFSQLISHPDFSFNGRNRRPPKDPVNALLSFGYTLLHNLVETAANIVGLDPYLGALHAVEYGRPSLVCDLVEEFRAFFVDSLVLSMLNRRAISPDDFVYRDVADGIDYTDEVEVRKNRPVEMKRVVVRAFIDTFERKMRTKITYGAEGHSVTYRYVVEQQARRFARYLIGREETYVPFTWTS